MNVVNHASFTPNTDWACYAVCVGGCAALCAITDGVGSVAGAETSYDTAIVL
ncbi:hypothetical protein [Thermoanaerobacterium thermosaccharolyticum]|uniref:hypothetical protein n=1 Tax=Thermoanaerobacterium thermosaccharolyticum TaxID=1517 RepID=UPI0015C67403|nr:hypothetical protein [Thermoanaerobacterium thermosaccharolyticum]